MLLKKNANQNTIVKIKNLKQSDFVLPIFLTKEPLRRGGDISLNTGNVHPYIKEKMLSVFLGKSKLYTLPYWKCNQYDNMFSTMDIKFDNIQLNDLLKSRRLERYLKEKCNVSTDKFDFIELNEKDDYYYYIEQIKKHKIYDINWSTIINTESETIKNIFTTNSLIQKTYEKKFLKDENIYKENIKIADYKNFFQC